MTAFWPSDLAARIAIAAAFISAIATLGSVWSALFARDQASSARISANAATETLRRSDEDLRVLAEVDRAASISLSLTVLDENVSFEIRFPASAVIINTGGRSAVVTDSEVETYATASAHMSRTDIFDASTRDPWPQLVVIRPDEPLRLHLLGTLSGSTRQLPVVTKALAMLFAQREHQNGSLQRQFDSLEAFHQAVQSHSGEKVASEFDSFLYGPAAKAGSISSDPWSEKGETGYSRIILKLSTAARRTYRSSPGLLVVGPDPAYSVQDAP